MLVCNIVCTPLNIATFNMNGTFFMEPKMVLLLHRCNTSLLELVCVLEFYSKSKLCSFHENHGIYILDYQTYEHGRLVFIHMIFRVI